MNETPESVWQSFWKSICSNPDGSLNEDQIKKELFDFYQAMESVPKVYDHITGGVLSKINTDPKHVIDFAEEHYEKHWRCLWEDEKAQFNSVTDSTDNGSTSQRVDDQPKNK